jgi:DNA-binding SARP family transcriptional activator
MRLDSGRFVVADGRVQRYGVPIPHCGLGDVAASRGLVPKALQAAEQGIAIDRLHEPCWRLALKAEAVLGLRDAVATRYERLVAQLDDQLGVRPEAETVAIFRKRLA